MSTYKELLQKREALNAEIEQARKTEVFAVRAQILELMNTYGISLDELGKGKPSGSSLAGIRVAVKYKDDTTDGTWTGRGVRPKWLQAKLAAGRPLEDFLV